MKFFTHYISIFLLIFFFSCSEESIMLYHPQEPEPEIPQEPEYYWLLKTVSYPDESPGFTSRSGQTFTYTDDDLMRTIKSSNIKDSTIIIDYLNNKISYSRIIRSSETVTYYDSLLVFINSNKQADYALHVRYTEKTSNGDVSKNISINDSTTFVYNADGYMQQLDHYDRTGITSSLNYSEIYTIVDGNITEVTTSKGYQFIYSYDDKTHAAPSEYCYEMPRNTFNMATTCWLMVNLPFLSEYMGTRSKNNIIRTEIINTKDNTKHSDIKYDYTFDENELVSQISISGVTKNETFENLVTSFTYIQKEKEKE